MIREEIGQKQEWLLRKYSRIERYRYEKEMQWKGNIPKRDCPRNI